MYVETAPRFSLPVIKPARRDLGALVSRIAFGALTVTLPDGEQATYRGSEPGPVADIRIHRLRAVRRLLVGGHLGFAQSYIDGDWDSSDLAALIALAAHNETILGATIDGRFWLRALHRGLHLLRRNSKRGARRNIAAHYDLGNEFYGLWLDPTMTYSAALFDGSNDTLEAAQRRKYARLAELADLRPEHEVLEIGCGWGGFCVWAACEIGCRVTAITISQRQYDYVRARISAAGLSELVEVRLQDYRDLRGRYDRIVSIEMLEAAGESYWPVFFAMLRERLIAGGRAALQVITIDDAVFPAYRERVDFIQRYIFPGGMLPSSSTIREAVGAAGLTWRQDSDHGPDYARTLAAWHRRFEQAWPKVAALGFDERFHRLWRYYLAYCEAGFRSARINLMRFSLDRP
ncbi:MAG: cyclopropane-fatty-acyl-phospholipid synthase family protein [Alphaproteobacteria bacterium]|nr:cyclopropane-fatty-acyl-phospholipid synthase family protein [Alphaproteobacteria bacterium]